MTSSPRIKYDPSMKNSWISLPSYKRLDPYNVFMLLILRLIIIFLMEVNVKKIIFFKEAALVESVNAYFYFLDGTGNQ